MFKLLTINSGTDKSISKSNLNSSRNVLLRHIDEFVQHTQVTVGRATGDEAWEYLFKYLFFLFTKILLRNRDVLAVFILWVRELERKIVDLYLSTLRRTFSFWQVKREYPSLWTPILSHWPIVFNVLYLHWVPFIRSPQFTSNNSRVFWHFETEKLSLRLKNH